MENRGHPRRINEKWNMAQVTTVRLVDDLDGTEADESISFALDGVALEIDLSNDNAETLLASSLRTSPRRAAGTGSVLVDRSA